MSEIVFEKQSLASRVIIDPRLVINRDYIKDQLVGTLTAFILECDKQEWSKTIDFGRPSFTDWLFRRKRIGVMSLRVSDVLLDPPSIPGSTYRLLKFNAFTKEKDHVTLFL